MIETKIVDLPIGGKCIVEIDNDLIGALAQAKEIPLYQTFELPEYDDVVVCEHGKRFQEQLDDKTVLFWSIFWASDAYACYDKELEIPPSAFGGYLIAEVELVTETSGTGWSSCIRNTIVSVGSHEFYGCENYYNEDIKASDSPDDTIQYTLFAQLLLEISQLI